MGTCVEVCGQVRPVKERVPKDEQRYQRSDDSGQEQRAHVADHVTVWRSRPAIVG